MITVGDFIISRLNIIYFVKAKGLNDRFGKEFDGDILLSDKTITITDIINTNYICNHKLMNKAMKYLIERHRL